jgi:hypothetical protein
MKGGLLRRLIETGRRRIVYLAIAGYLGVLAIAMAGVAYHTYFYVKTPEQPVQFNHGVHVAELGLACDYCHQYAGRSASAGIPPVGLCMECHEKAARDNPEVAKLVQYWERKEPVPWVRVHSLAGYVYFTHKRHIKARIDCTLCHGDVPAMTVARKVKSLEMGWCVSCHRAEGAPTDCLTCHK